MDLNLAIKLSWIALPKSITACFGSENASFNLSNTLNPVSWRKPKNLSKIACNGLNTFVNASAPL